jgi:hypothetical protein
MAMSSAWSKQIEKHYHLHIPPELASWFDEGLWRQLGQSEFRYPLHPEQFIEPADGTIWAGFMLPDTLPLVGNQYGDWLCLRVTPEGRVAEVICWNHGGGDWIPYGRNLCEALLYDACLAGRGMYAVEEKPTAIDFAACPTVRWASDWTVRTHPQLGPSREWLCVDRPAIAERLLAAGVAETVIRRDRMLQALDSPLRSCSGPELAGRLDVRWEPEFVRWIFDTDLIPQSAREALGRLSTLSLDGFFRQNWGFAERQALAVIRLRQDLGWPFHIAGWSAERRGDFRQAISLYAQGVRTSLFADESVRFRTHWYPEGLGKFAAARLDHLRQHLPPKLRGDPYLHLFWENDPASLRNRLRDYWLERAKQHFQGKHYMHAYQCYFLAGWDSGSSDLDVYAEILEGIVASATASGSSALSSVARTHQRFLRA